MNMNRTVKRGDIYYINRCSEREVGSEMHSGRPAVIVSNDALNATSDCVEVVFLTSKPKKNMPEHCTILSRGELGTTICEQINTVSKSRLGSWNGVCSEDEIKAIDNCLRASLGLKNDKMFTSVKEIESPLPQEPKASEKTGEEIIKITAERDTYKSMYETLLHKIITH